MPNLHLVHDKDHGWSAFLASSPGGAWFLDAWSALREIEAN